MTLFDERAADVGEVWTEEDSVALDEWAKTFRRTPLEYDPRLAEVIAARCGECDRILRPKRVPAEERPGTVRRISSELCDSCYRQAVKRSRPDAEVVRLPGVDLCSWCQVSMRPNGALLSDFPGTVARSSATTCQTCHKVLRDGRTPPKARQPRHQKRMPPHCLDCGARLRPQGSVWEEGTKMHQARGLCTCCHSRRRRRGEPT